MYVANVRRVQLFVVVLVYSSQPGRFIALKALDGVSNSLFLTIRLETSQK